VKILRIILVGLRAKPGKNGQKKAKHMRPLLQKGATSPQGFSFLTKGFITINGNSFGVWSQPHYSSIGILPTAAN
jgi:hypothetical protein